MKKKIIGSFLLLVACASSMFAQSTLSVDWFNGASTLFRDSAGNALSQGTAALNNDGMLVQLGYYSQATAGNNFAGVWIPLTGFGTTFPRTTIGDSPDNSGLGAGRIGMSTGFDLNSNLVRVYEPAAGDSGAYITQSSVTITSATPAAGQILSIRFYDTNSGTTGRYNAVSSNSWAWITPTDAGPTLALNLNTATLTFESFNAFGAAGNFRTVILIPEPSTYMLLGLGALGMTMLYRRRAKSVA